MTEEKKVVESKVSQKDLTTLLSKTKSSLNIKIDEIVSGVVDAQKSSIDGMLLINNAFQKNLIGHLPTDTTHAGLTKYFKETVCSDLLGKTWDFFTKSGVSKKDLEKMNDNDPRFKKAEEEKIYKVGNLKGRAFLNFCKGGYTIFVLNALFKNQVDKSGRLFIKMNAVEKLYKEKNQEYWNNKFDSTDMTGYSKFSYNDMIRAYLTMFGVIRESDNNSKLYNLLLQVINECSEDFEKIILKSYQDCFISNESFSNKTIIYKAIEKLTDIYVGRAEHSTVGQGGKKHFDDVAKNLGSEYEKMLTEIDGNAPVQNVA